MTLSSRPTASIFVVRPVDADLVQPWVEGYEVAPVFYKDEWLEVSLGDA